MSAVFRSSVAADAPPASHRSFAVHVSLNILVDHFTSFDFRDCDPSVAVLVELFLSVSFLDVHTFISLSTFFVQTRPRVVADCDSSIKYSRNSGSTPLTESGHAQMGHIECTHEGVRRTLRASLTP